MIIKILKIIVFGVGAYYILSFVVRLYNARKKNSSANATDAKVSTGQRDINKQEHNIHPSNKKSIINPEAGEYTDYEELKD